MRGHKKIYVEFAKKFQKEVGTVKNLRNTALDLGLCDNSSLFYYSKPRCK
jgi:hypothetical protein